MSRCPNCGKRNPPDTTRCAACSYEFIPRRARVRCNHCGKRVPADQLECPHCGKDPNASRIPFAARVVAIFLVAILIGCCGWIAFRAVTVGFGANLAPPNPTPTQVVQIIIVVATTAAPPPTAQLLPSPTPTRTTTPTSRFSPTPTRRGARATLTPTVTRTVPPPFYAAPRLVAPLNATIYTGADAAITLEWQAVAPSGLRENEWYLVSLAHTGGDGKPATRKGWSKETRWSVIRDWYADISPDARTVSWNVTVMRVEGADPFGAPSTPGSPPSATQTFIWNR